MYKWIAALAVAVWVAGDGLAAFSLDQLVVYRDYLMSLGIALAMMPWLVRQLDG
jgi:hypothetical protein